MLQICSGKLFRREAEYRDDLRGVIFTNLRVREAIETAAGRVLPLEVTGHPQAFAFEFTELIEATGDGPGVVVSRTAEPYLSEFAVVASFGLNATCSPDMMLVERLSSGRRGIRVSDPPARFIPRVFERDVWLQNDEVEQFQVFVQSLLDLERHSYRAAVRAMATYITGLHRMADDLELAYTLLVASLESLAQGFDGHKGGWADYEQAKRQRIDGALALASDDVASAVRDAVLENEHLTLKRRFRDFTLDHIGQSFFRSEAVGVPSPIGRRQLRGALERSYQLRSSYIHKLLELPRPLTVAAMAGDTVEIDRKESLTFRGLARVARHTIFEFVRRQPKVKLEVYNYFLEQPGVVSLPMAPQYWVGRAEGLTKDQGRMRLQGTLEQLVGHFRGDANAQLTDVREVLSAAEPWLPQMSVSHRRPFVALHILFNGLVSSSQRMPTSDSVHDKYAKDFEGPSSEALILNLLFDVKASWNLADHEAAVERYYAERAHRDGLRFPPLFEAAIALSLVERFRQAGQIDEARRVLSSAVDNYPGMPSLAAIEDRFSSDTVIDWRQILLPRAEECSSGALPDD